MKRVDEELKKSDGIYEQLTSINTKTFADCERFTNSEVPEFFFIVLIGGVGWLFIT
ncbi:uncharacterized protein Dsimw501_GD28111 [Drosophila simulans]|uniref:Uncharacterized protein n=1 Tax=Drosophila simulans TaxID=7240 RepID=A0A0J9R759_DROSI|nr:uncharacterized protein Dsimw501_GD29613 [Drosophila simulans]KMY91519.1 uncharacterized protein Dsimw501_GD28111 [Drosophila simulans]